MRAGLPGSVVRATNQFVGHDFPEKRNRSRRCFGVTNNDDSTLVHDDPIDEPGVVGGTGTAPTPSFNVQLNPLISYFEKALGAVEELPPEIGDEAKGVHVGPEIVDNPCQLISLRWGVELNFIAHQVVKPPESPRGLQCEMVKVKFGCYLDCFNAHPEARRDPGPVTVELRKQHPALMASRQIVVNL